MDKSQKTKEIDLLKENFKGAQAAFFADYKGLTVEKVDLLRRELRPLKVKVKVVKNNLARIAAKEAGLSQEVISLVDSLSGPTMVTFAFNDAAAVAKVIARFSEENEVYSLKDGVLGVKRLSRLEVGALAKLPSREVLLAKVLGTLNAPVTNFVGVLAAVPRSLVQVLGAIQHKKAQQSS